MLLVIEFAKTYCRALAISSLAALCIGCGSIVDPNPQSTNTSEVDVSNYYTRIQNPGSKYYFSMTTPKGADYLTMTMKGATSNTYGAPCYYCDWKYKDGSSEPWYYSINAQKGEDLGDSSDFANNNRWVDLQSPLSIDAKWSFDHGGSVIIASVIGYGVTAQLGGHEYKDVVQVHYQGPDVDGVRWFARGIGQIYSNMTYGTYTQKESLDSVRIVN